MAHLRALAPVFALAILGAGCSINLNAEQWVGTEEKTFAVDGRAELTLKTFDGSIEVRAWDRPEVALTIERRAGSKAEGEALEVKTSQEGNRIVVEAIQPPREVQVGFHVGRGVRLIASVPKTTDLLARSGDGSVTVSGIHGRLELRSGDGSIKGTGLDGAVTAHTGDGSVTLEGVRGALDVHTGDGSVKVSGAPTVVRANTGDGSVTLDLDGEVVAADDWEITTGDGGVKVTLPASFNAELDASTGDGAVDASDFGLEAEGESRRAVRGRLGTGGKTFKVRTGDGSIAVAKK